MVVRVLKVGLLAGLLAGLLVALLQQAATTPLILKAETYEAASGGAAPAAQSHDRHAHDHGDAWKPKEGLERFAFTAIATIATAVGVSFVLLAAMLVAGATIDRRSAITWAIAGFIAVGLAPAAGLAPELPGSASGDLTGRQAWWIGTAVATALSLWMLARFDSPLVIVAA
ncbi:MAG: CbtA family protein, partial [Candidatus Sericytochromatia bacterium]|nr:CbtA family protein [Candidatus Tanganyikabacteria bacterium]